MSDEQINIAIAEACGWKPIIISTDMMGKPFPGWDEPPNYCNNLNAMHEAENVGLVTVGHWICYMENLSKNSPAPNHATAWELAVRMSHNDHKGVLYALAGFVRAKARQRAEAFLRTIGKWEDGK